LPTSGQFSNILKADATFGANAKAFFKPNFPKVWNFREIQATSTAKLKIQQPSFSPCHNLPHPKK
jgi:hypothetical protein